MTADLLALANQEIITLKEEIEKLIDANALLGEANQGLGIRNSELMVKASAVDEHIKWLNDQIESLHNRDRIIPLSEFGNGCLDGLVKSLENIKKEACG